MPSKAEVLARVLPLLLAAAIPAASHAQTAAPRAQVMVLGVWHMDNPGLDYANPTSDDVLAPRRQAEMEAAARAIAEFRPTRIALEAEPSRDSVWNARYQAYRRGTHTLTRDEREQLGFRIAGLLGHDRVYPVDYKLDMDVGGVIQYAMQNGQAEMAQRMGGVIQAAIAQANAEMATMSIGGLLAAANGARADSMHGWYMVMNTVGSDTAYPGAHEVSNWYRRNLHIFANIARVAQPGERVLVIMGAGHGTLLRQFVDESPELDLVTVDRYLAGVNPTASR